MSDKALARQSILTSSPQLDKITESTSTSTSFSTTISTASINSTASTNDNFADRISLSGISTSDIGSNIGATGELGEPDHAFSSQPLNSVWWSWTAPEDGNVIIDTFGSNYDTTLGVYTGSVVDNLTEVASNDDSPFNLRSLVQVEVTAGTTYQIAVDGFSGRVGDITLNLNLVEPPSNDNFADSISLTGSSVSDSGTNIGAIGELGEPDHAFSSQPLNSVWWSWTAPEDGVAIIDTFGSNYDTTLGVYTGSAVDNLTEIASNDDAFNFQSQVQFEVTAGTIYRIAVDGFSGTGNIILNINSFPATPGNDTIFGTPENDLIDALAGNDKVFGREGSDTLSGGDGDDLIKGEDGNDRLNGGKGDDELFGGEGNDFIVGGDGDDLLKGGDGIDELFGGKGDDELFGGDGFDTLGGGDGEDLLKGEGGNDRLNGGKGDDELFGGDGFDTLGGGDGEDLLKGEGGNDRLNGGKGDDKLFGGDGLDTLSGGDGDDLLKGGDGIDELFGGKGDDELFGGKGSELLDGGDGDDLLKGEEESDGLFGGNGDDTLDGGEESDAINGDNGDDLLKGGDDGDGLFGGEGNDTLDGGDGDDFLSGAGIGNFGVGEIDRLTGDQGADTFVLGDANIRYDDNAASVAASFAGQAIITDFTVGEDIIQLAGLGSYELVEISGSTQIREISDAVPEVIATVEGVTGLDLADSNQFLFV